MQIVRIDQSNLHLLDLFIKNLGESAKTFRYFNHRPSSRVLTNLFTGLAIMDNGEPVAYGHLEEENGIVWLGIAVLPGYQAKGLGKNMMDCLMEEALRLNIKVITLTVDKINERAQKLYLQYGFVVVGQTNEIYKMEKTVCLSKT
jgi:ribosomal protein S18 acetylase RimI-like enzyme